MQPKVSIVILNWNGKKHLQQFLPFVLASTYSNVEVVLADNASTDDSVAFVESNYPQTKIIRLSENFGFAKGYNEALKQVEADYFVLLNSDVEVEANWIEPVIHLMEKDKSIGACQPKLRMYADRTLFEYAGAAGGWLDHLGYPFARGRIFDICEKDNGQYDNEEKIFWASGAAMFVRSSVYREMGGLDEYFFAHQEEIDLCWRMQLHGYTIMACPSSVVYHLGGGTLPKGNERKVYLNFRNNLIMMAKNLPFRSALWKIPSRFFLDAISAWKTLFSGETHYITAIFKAHFAFLRWLVFNREKSVFAKRKNGKLNGYYTESIVWKHFVLGKKSFSEIPGIKK